MPKPTRRPYRKRKRAESEEKTRQRITEAAVELHGTVGPANTTLTDVAKLAGVSRMTVYNHFPTDVDLFTACSTHWAESNPFPDPSDWAEADPAERLEHALGELYTWFGRNRQMLSNVLQDLSKLPALAEVMGRVWEPYMAGVVRTLAGAWSIEDAEPEALRAALRLAVDFNSWQVLSESGLDDRAAAGLMARMVCGVLTQIATR